MGNRQHKIQAVETVNSHLSLTKSSFQNVIELDSQNKHTCIHVHTCVHNKHMHMHTCSYMHTCSFMHTCTCSYMHTQYTHAHTHMFIHAYTIECFSLICMIIQEYMYMQGCIQKFRPGGAIAIELPEKLSDHDLETKLNIWNRKPRRISI